MSAKRPVPLMRTCDNTRRSCVRENMHLNANDEEIEQGELLHEEECSDEMQYTNL